MTTRTVKDSRQRFHLTPTRIAHKHRLLPVGEQNLAHNTISRQKYFPTDEHAASTSATAVDPVQHVRKARKPNRNRTCFRTPMTPIEPECSSDANRVRTAGNAPLRRAASPRVSMAAEVHLQLGQDTATDSAFAGFAMHDPTKTCRVLIVDDDDLIISSVSSLLERSGYQVCAASSGEDAMRVLNAINCNIVITDWHMPDMDGLDLCRNIRSSGKSTYIYVLMLTVRNGSNDILAALSAGADDYVLKGAGAEEILARLEVGRRLT
jgi:CheY-like chemotaxis protein